MGSATGLPSPLTVAPGGDPPVLYGEFPQGLCEGGQSLQPATQSRFPAWVAGAPLLEPLWVPHGTHNGRNLEWKQRWDWDLGDPSDVTTAMPNTYFPSEISSLCNSELLHLGNGLGSADLLQAALLLSGACLPIPLIPANCM